MPRPIFSHSVEVIKDSPKGRTLYFFEIWDLELNEELFKALIKHPEVLCVTNIKNREEVSDHCEFLAKETAKKVFKECISCDGEGSFWNNCWSPGEDEWIPCSRCDGSCDEPLDLFEEVDPIRVSMAALVNVRYHGLNLLLKGSDGKGKPFGGAYQFNPSSRFITKTPSIILEKRTSLDLRFSISPKDLIDLKNWFYSKKERETTAIRELEEELCEENNILTKEQLQNFFNK